MKALLRLCPPQLAHVAGAFISKGLAASVQFLQSIILSRTLGPESLGLYYIALSVYRVAEAGAPLGLQTSTVREVAAAHAHGAWGSVHALALRSALMSGLLFLIAGGVTWAFAESIANALGGAPKAASALRWIAVAMVPGGIVLALSSVLRGLGRQGLANILGSLILPLIATISFVLLWRGQGYLGAVHAFIAGQCAALLFLAIALWRLMRHRPRRFVQGHSLFESAFPFWIVSLASLANDSLGILMLGFFGAPQDAGIFGIAVRLAMPLSFLGASIQAVCDSRFAGFHRLGDHAALMHDYRISQRAAWVLSLIMALGLGLFSDPLLRLFGPEFVRAEPAFRILLVSVCLLSAFGPAGSFLSMTGKAHVNAWTAVGTMPVAALLMALLIPQFGAMGAALATSAALSLRVLIQLAVMRQVLRDLKHRAKGT